MTMTPRSTTTETDRETAASPCPRQPRTTRTGHREGGGVVRQRTIRGCHAVAARVSPERWIQPRNTSQVAAARPPRRSHARGGRVHGPEVRGDQGVGGVQGHAPDPTTPGEDLSVVFDLPGRLEGLMSVLVDFYIFISIIYLYGLHMES